MNREHELTTADLARPRDDMRGRSDEHIVAREEHDKRIRADAPAPTTTAAPHREDARREGMNAAPARETRALLFPEEEAARFHERWTDAQAAFVDEPRAAVERADSLVAEVMKKLAEGFANERATLEKQWDRCDNVTTEDLRIALQRYRSFFDRLLKI